MTKELRRCPFCGGEAKISLFLGNYGVACTKCLGAILPVYGTTKEENIEAWNRRVPTAYDPEKVVEKLEAKSERVADEVEEIYHSGKIFTEEGGRYFVERVFAEAIEIVKKGGANE